MITPLCPHGRAYGTCLMCYHDLVAEQQSEISALRAALVHSVTVIQGWHNMDVPTKATSVLWDLYWQNAPEMAAIKNALKRPQGRLASNSPNVPDRAGHPFEPNDDGQCKHCGEYEGA